MTTEKWLYIVRRNEVDAKYLPHTVDQMYEKRKWVSDTPKGKRVELSYCVGKGTVYLHERYHFFESEAEALEHLEYELRKVIGELQDRVGGFKEIMAATRFKRLQVLG